MLKLYTRDNGWFLREENQLGIDRGRQARRPRRSSTSDYFTVPDERLRQIRSVLTVVGGEVVHDTGAVSVMSVHT